MFSPVPTTGSSNSQNNAPATSNSSNTNNNSAAMVLAAALAARNFPITAPLPSNNNAATDFLMPFLLNGWIAALKAQQTQQQQTQSPPPPIVSIALEKSPSPASESPSETLNVVDPDEPLNLSTKLSPPSEHLTTQPSVVMPIPQINSLEKSLNRRRGRPIGEPAGTLEPVAASSKRHCPDDDNEQARELQHPTSSGRGGRGGSHNKTPKRFHCNQCGRGFTRSDGLQRHLRLHSGYRPFTCTVCRRSFSRSDHAQVHIRRHFIVNPATAFAIPPNNISNSSSNVQIAPSDLLIITEPTSLLIPNQEHSAPMSNNSPSSSIISSHHSSGAAADDDPISSNTTQKDDE